MKTKKNIAIGKGRMRAKRQAHTMVKVKSPPPGSAHCVRGCMAGVWAATEASISVVLVLEGLRKAGASEAGAGCQGH